jgi:hypothetical protein
MAQQETKQKSTAGESQPASELSQFEAYVEALPRNEDGSYRKPVQPKEDDFATFVICGCSSPHHRYLFKATDEEDRPAVGSRIVKRMAKLGTDLTAQFEDGLFRTADPNLWLRMLQCDLYGTRYTINDTDPSGFWRKVGFLTQAEITRIEINGTSGDDPKEVARTALANMKPVATSGVPIVVGARTAASMNPALAPR